MRYEARVEHGLSALASSSISPTHATSRRPGSVLTITCQRPVPIEELVRLFDRLGTEIEEIDCYVVDPGG